MIFLVAKALTELYHLAIFLPLKQAFMSILGETKISLTAIITVY
jgi:hypothetical protein